EVGVRCVEVTLDGWDTHANNHVLHRERLAVLDPAFSALVGDLKDHGLLERTVVLCAGEFGRTPKINAAGGRDHWPNGFSLALAGACRRRGRREPGAAAARDRGGRETDDGARLANHVVRDDGPATADLVLNPLRRHRGGRLARRRKNV